MANSCFDALGIPPGASEREIKKAFRRRAVEVHPDKVPPDRKEEANRAFRELHEAYEEAMEHSRNKGSDDSAFEHNDSHSSKNSSWSKTKRKTRATDSNIKKTFNDICEELDRESSMRYDEKLLELTRQVRAAWPNKEECWNVADVPFFLSEIVDALTRDSPELAAYLKKRQDDKMSDFRAEEETELRLRVQKFNREWPSRKNELRQWVKSDGIWTCDWENTANRVRNPEAARHIRLWVAERTADRDRKWMEEYKAAAEEIVRVYPNQARIRSILNCHFFLDHREIYKLLPDDIRAAFSEWDRLRLQQ